MRILWLINRKDGSTLRIIIEQPAAPSPGDGAIVSGVPVAIRSVLTTPMLGELELHDIVVSAEEQ